MEKHQVRFDGYLSGSGQGNIGMRAEKKPNLTKKKGTSSSKRKRSLPKLPHGNDRSLS